MNTLWKRWWVTRIGSILAGLIAIPRWLVGKLTPPAVQLTACPDCGGQGYHTQSPSVWTQIEIPGQKVLYLCVTCGGDGWLR